MNYKHLNTLYSFVNIFLKKLWGFHGGLIRPNDNIIFRSAFYTISPEGIEPHRCVCLKKWPGRLVTLQHLVLFRDTLIYFSYYRILNLLTSQRNRTFSEQSRLLLYHALRTSTCQISIAWLESNQRPVLIHTFTVSFTIIVSTDLPLNYTQSKMVGAVGLAPT